MTDIEKLKEDRVRAERDEWKDACRRAGVCMSYATSSRDPMGCTDCLNTGWDGGAPIEAQEAIARAEAAESRLTTALAVLGEAREALEPFAETPEHGSYGGPLVCAIILYEDETDKRAGRYAPRLTSENFRKARAALAKLSAFEENEDERSASNGAGPEGETCKSCAHIHRNQMAKAFLKCSLMCHRWERK